MNEQDNKSVDLSRRKTMAKLGAFAVFTAPAIMTLMVSNKATAQSMTIGGGEAPGSVTINPEEGTGEVCVGGNNTCP